jgi:soluble lytic murein transglycosylase-like protein
MKKVVSVPEASMFHARAKFWRYQAAIALGNEKLKSETKEILLHDHPLTFQNLAANGEDQSMMERVISHDVPSVFTRSLIRPDLNVILRAAEALEKSGSSQLAAEILDRNVNEIGTIEPEVRLYTAAFLDRIGYSLPKFKILSSLFQDSPKLVTMSTMELMFPLSYVDIVRKKQSAMDPLLFLSLMRQESAFNPQARSGVGARGLMQLMPATARGVRRVSKAQLYVPEINIEVGTKYFLGRLAQYGGDVELTLAAYNAGFARVDQWIKRYPTDNKLLFLDFIPFRETRDYVSAILRNYYWYVRLYAPDTSAVALESGKIQQGPLPGADKMQSILTANAGDAARLNPLRAPASVAPLGN